jgi:hypothetical protein
VANPYTTMKETFNSLDRHRRCTAAIRAHVRIRRDARAPRQSTCRSTAATRSPPHMAILLGELGCTQNHSVALLERGVDLGRGRIDATRSDFISHMLARPAEAVG